MEPPVYNPNLPIGPIGPIGPTTLPAVNPDTTRLINVIHRAVLEKLTEQGAVPLPLTPDQLRVSVECVTDAVKNSMKGRDLLNDRLSIQKEATIRSFTEIPQAIYKATQGQTLPAEATSLKSVETQKEGFLPIDDLVADELRRRNDQDTKLGVNPPPPTERKLNVVSVPFKSTTQTPEMDDMYKPVDPQSIKYTTRPNDTRERVVSLVPAPAPAPVPVPDKVQPKEEPTRKPSLLERRQARLQLLQKIKDDKEKQKSQPQPEAPAQSEARPQPQPQPQSSDQNLRRTIISSPPSGVDSLRWEYTLGDDHSNLLTVTRLQIPRILFNGYIPYILLKIRQIEDDKPVIHNIPLFQIPSAISDGMTNWKPDYDSNIYLQSSENIEFMIAKPDGDILSLISSDHSRFEKKSRFITGYSKQSNPDIVYPISEIDTSSTETFKYNLQKYSVNLFMTG